MIQKVAFRDGALLTIGFDRKNFQKLFNISTADFPCMKTLNSAAAAAAAEQNL